MFQKTFKYKFFLIPILRGWQSTYEYLAVVVVVRTTSGGRRRLPESSTSSHSSPNRKLLEKLLEIGDIHFPTRFCMQLRIAHNCLGFFSSTTYE
jgi:hypothetical protein